MGRIVICHGPSWYSSNIHQEHEMRNKLFVVLSAIALALSAGLAGAQEADDGAMEDQMPSRAEMHERMQNMSPEEREAFRSERRAKWEGMSEEEREAARAKRSQMREKHRARWESMSDEERAAAPGRHHDKGKKHRQHSPKADD